MTADLYDYWREALEGRFGPVHGNDPQLGFWRTKKGEPVAIYHDNFGLLVAKQGERAVDPEDVWTWCCTKPVTHEAYTAAMEGKGWPDDIAPRDGIGGNNPPADEIEADEIDSAINAALAELKTPLKTQTDADRLGNHRDNLAKLYKREDSKKDAEKRPHLDANIEIENRYRPVLGKIKDAGTKVKDALTAYFKAIQDETERQIREARAAQEAQRKAALEANQPPPPIAPIPEPERPKAGTMGRATALRTFRSAIITDYKAALTHLREHAEIKDAVQKIANAAARAGTPIPGTEIREELRAA